MKKFKISEAQAIIKWFNDFREDRIKTLPIKTQWDLLSNIKLLEPSVEKFEEFREGLLKDLQDEFFGEEKSVKNKIPQRDANGNKILDEDGNPILEDGRTVKPEFMGEYREKIEEINKSIVEVLSEESEYDFKELDVDQIIERLPNDTKVELSDIEMISLIG